MSEAKVKVVEDLPGVGPAIAEKLREAGYDTLEAIGTQAPGTLSDRFAKTMVLAICTNTTCPLCFLRLF